MPNSTRDTPMLVHVVDDDEALRHSLTFLLASAGIAARTYGSAEDFLATLPTDLPGCLILDVRMPGMSGLELQTLLAERAPQLPIIFISGHGDIPMAVGAMRAGAVVFLEKPFNDETLLGHVTEALRRSSAIVAQSDRREDVRRRIERLTGREAEVMRLVAAGKPNKVIAFELDISIKTVEVHRHNVMEKMQAHSVADLTRMLIGADAIGENP